jgi:dynein heavy chain
VLPSTVDQFVVYMDNVNKVSLQMEPLGNTSQEITAMSLLIEELKIRIPEKYKSKFSEVNSQVGTLRKKVEDAMASYDQNLNRFRKDMEKMMPQIDTKIGELKDLLEEQPIGTVTADINKLVSFIKHIRVELD